MLTSVKDFWRNKGDHSKIANPSVHASQEGHHSRQCLIGIERNKLYLDNINKVLISLVVFNLKTAY